MVVVHYKSDALMHLLYAFVATHDSGADDAKFDFGCECGIHPYTGDGECYMIVGLSFPF